MSSFFRDSNLFSTRNKGSLFQSATTSVVASSSSGMNNTTECKQSDNRKRSRIITPGIDVAKPFNEDKQNNSNRNSKGFYRHSDKAAQQFYENNYKQKNGDINANDGIQSNPNNIINKRLHTIEIESKDSDEEKKDDEDDDNGDDNDDEDVSLNYSNSNVDNDDKKTENVQLKRAQEESDEEIEITNVRDVTLDDYSDNTGETTTNFDHSLLENNQLQSKENTIKTEPFGNMDNVSMEYLLNTISHLSEKNKQLQNEIKSVQSQNKNLADTLKSRSDSIDILKNRISKFKTTMNNSSILLKEFKLKITDLNYKNTGLVENLEKTKQSLKKEHEFLYSLKGLVSNLKTQNSLNEINISQKTQRIESLENKANDLAGRLSEEKIKNSKLHKELTDASNKYESELYQTTAENRRLLELILEQRDNFKSTWEGFIIDLNNKVENAKLNNETSVKQLNSVIVNNFNDIALRITNFGISKDSFEELFSSARDNTFAIKEDLVSVLSTVDKHIAENQNNHMTALLQKLEEKCSANQLIELSNKLCEFKNMTSEKDEIISQLQDENRKELEFRLKIEKQYDILKTNFDFKVAENKTQCDDNKKIKIEKVDMLAKQSKVISDLQKEKERVLSQLESVNQKNEELIEKHQTILSRVEQISNFLEKQNSKTLDEEKKNTNKLLMEKQLAEKNYEDMNIQKVTVEKEKEMLKELNKTLTIELKEIKNKYNGQIILAKDYETKLDFQTHKADILSTDKDHLQQLKENLCCDVDKLKSELNLKNIELKELKDQIKSEDITSVKNEKSEKLLEELEKYRLQIATQSLNLFAKSRMSTTINQENIETVEKSNENSAISLLVPKQQLIKPENIKPTKKNKRAGRGKKQDKKEDLLTHKDLIKPQTASIAKSNVTKQKRKLITSSQVSVRSSQKKSKNDKANDLTKNILKDLDIFNEFDAIDRLGTITKPGW